MAKDDVIVVGLGEVGKPLRELLSEKYRTIGIDIEPVPTDGECAVLHICYPFSDRFVETAVEYIKQHRPTLAVINSTVATGTTRRIHRLTGMPLAYSPVRGKHFKMKHDLFRYTKFIGGINFNTALRASEHFQAVGMKTKVLASPEAAELAKLTETTYFGVLIAWAQEVERYCRNYEVDYDEVVSFYDEIAFLPRVKYTPGVIGGHCVMPNIQILKRMFQSNLLDAIVASNELKSQSDRLKAKAAAHDDILH